MSHPMLLHPDSMKSISTYFGKFPNEQEMPVTAFQGRLNDSEEKIYGYFWSNTVDKTNQIVSRFFATTEPIANLHSLASRVIGDKIELFDVSESERASDASPIAVISLKDVVTYPSVEFGEEMIMSVKEGMIQMAPIEVGVKAFIAAHQAPSQPLRVSEELIKMISGSLQRRNEQYAFSQTPIPSYPPPCPGIDAIQTAIAAAATSTMESSSSSSSTGLPVFGESSTPSTDIFKRIGLESSLSIALDSLTLNPGFIATRTSCFCKMGSEEVEVFVAEANFKQGEERVFLFFWPGKVSSDTRNTDSRFYVTTTLLPQENSFKYKTMGEKLYLYERRETERKPQAKPKAIIPLRDVVTYPALHFNELTLLGGNQDSMQELLFEIGLKAFLLAHKANKSRLILTEDFIHHLKESISVASTPNIQNEKEEPPIAQTVVTTSLDPTNAAMPLLKEPSETVFPEEYIGLKRYEIWLKQARPYTQKMQEWYTRAKIWVFSAARYLLKRKPS